MAPGHGSTGRGGPRVARLRRTPGGRPGLRAPRPFRASAADSAAPRPRLTSRAAVLVLVLAVLAVSYASSLRAYFEQRHHIQTLRAGIADSEADIAELQRERRRWKDDAYVISQARARFAFGFPGEIGYRVLDADGEPLDHEDSLSDPKSFEDPEPEWWQSTLTSIEVAGNPPKESSGPADKITAPPAPERQR